MKFVKLPKLKKGDNVALLSPSFAAPGRWPHVYELGLQRLREVFELVPVAFGSTCNLQASTSDKAKDLVASFEDPAIRAVITTLGGDEQVTYISKIPKDSFIAQPKPFFGISDNTHIINHLWLNGIPSFYGGTLFTEFAMHGAMDEFTIKYLRHAFFSDQVVKLEASEQFNDIGLNWSDPRELTQRRRYQKNDGWHWDGANSGEGITWGGCLESLDEMLRHGIEIPSLRDFEQVILFVETSEELPPEEYVFRFFRALGERGILERVRGVIAGRAKAWEFGKEKSDEEKVIYKQRQMETILQTVRRYNSGIPVVQNMDFGHTAPQFCLPVGKTMTIEPDSRTVAVEF